MVDAESLPVFLGGTCTCAEYGGCHKSNAGPWNKYEACYPFGVKAIGDAPAPIYYDRSKMDQLEESKE